MPYLTPDSAPEDTVCRTLEIPNDQMWLAIVDGALSELLSVRRFEKFGTATPAETAERFEQMFSAYLASECEGTMAIDYPYSAIVFPHEAIVINGNGWSRAINAADHFCASSFQNTPAQYDHFQASFFLRENTCTIEVGHLKSSTYGIADIYVDDEFVFSLDCYNSTTLHGQITTDTVAVSGDGVHYVDVYINGKNASSSNYYFSWSYIAFRPEG
jgi:hypothetical protein